MIKRSRHQYIMRGDDEQIHHHICMVAHGWPFRLYFAVKSPGGDYSIAMSATGANSSGVSAPYNLCLRSFGHDSVNKSECVRVLGIKFPECNGKIAVNEGVN